MLGRLNAAWRVARCGLAPARPSSLVFINTMKCNARCKMCLQWREVRGPDSQGRTELTLEQIDRFTSSMGRLFMVQLSGGEPFLRPDMGETMLLIGRNCAPLLFTVPTNGSHPDRILSAVRAFCAAYPKTMLRLNLSVDAPAETHDAIRGIDGLYEKCRETITRLKEIQTRAPGLTVNICAVLSHYNRAGIRPGIKRILDELCPDHLTLMLARGDTPEAIALEVPIEEYEAAVADLRAHLEARSEEKHPLRNLGRVLEKEISRVVAESAKQQRQVIPCVGGSKHIYVDDQGRILPCEVLVSILRDHPSNELDSAVMADLADFDYSVPAALDSMHARRVAQFIRDGKCHCTSECLAAPSILLNPRLYPRLALTAFRQAVSDLVVSRRRPPAP